MATSGSTDFTLTRDDIITEALEILDSVATSASVPSDDTTSANRTFNIFVKALQTDGVLLWKREWTQVQLTASTIVSNSGTNYVCRKSHTSSAADEPGTGANWTTYWETTTDTAGGAWALSTSYNFIADFTMDSKYISVDQVFLREEINGKTYDYNVDVRPFGDYLTITDKNTTSGSISHSVFFEESLSQLTGYLYPKPETNMVVHALAQSTIEDFDAGTDNPDFPVRWFEALVYGLVVRLAPKYGVIGDRLAQFSIIYEQALKKAQEDNKEHTPLHIRPTYSP